jgi:GMP synthase (glutamine-hydrolysing)
VSTVQVPRVLVVQHEADCPPAWVGDWLVEAGCVLDVRHPYRGDALPADLESHDALLVLGGAMGANDDATCPWLTPTKDLVRVAAEAAVPTLGICLGHQLVAVALGGEVGPNPHGQQLGLVPMGWTEAAGLDELMRPLTATRSGVHWNNDIVLRAPDGTVVLATSPRGELQAARFAPGIWGVQLHPEVDERILETWAEEDRERYDQGVLEDVLRTVASARDDLVVGWRPLAQALAGLTRPVA